MRSGFFLLSVLLALGPSPGAADAGSISLRYGQIDSSLRSFSSLALYISQRKGFLAREGIDLDIVLLPGEGTMIDALDENEADLVHVATPYLIQWAVRGSDAVAVVGGPANTISSLIVRPEIRSYEDLRGKVIALTGRQDTLTIGTLMLLARHGIGEDDFQFRDLRGSNTWIDCMTNGDCAAAVLSAPSDFLAVRDGFVKLGDSFEVFNVLQFNVVAARRAWAAQPPILKNGRAKRAWALANEDALTRFARAFADAYRFMRDPARRDEVVGIMVETMELPEPVARDLLAFSFEPDRGVMPRQGEISLAGLTKVIELLGDSGQLDGTLPAAERFVDLRYLQAAGAQ